MVKNKKSIYALSNTIKQYNAKVYYCIPYLNLVPEYCKNKEGTLQAKLRRKHQDLTVKIRKWINASLISIAVYIGKKLKYKSLFILLEEWKNRIGFLFVIIGGQKFSKQVHKALGTSFNCHFNPYAPCLSKLKWIFGNIIKRHVLPSKTIQEIDFSYTHKRIGQITAQLPLSLLSIMTNAQKPDYSNWMEMDNAQCIFKSIGDHLTHTYNIDFNQLSVHEMKCSKIFINQNKECVSNFELNKVTINKTLPQVVTTFILAAFKELIGEIL